MGSHAFNSPAEGGGDDIGVESTADILKDCHLQEVNNVEVHSRTATSLDQEYKTVEVAMILGGMDTEGEIFEDCLVMLLREL